MFKKIFKKKKQLSDNKFSEKQFFAFGVNFVIGFGFIATIGSIVKLGSWGMLVFAITAFIAFGTALAFARASQKYPDEIGGSYSYAKKAFKSKAAWFLQGWNVFAQIPIGSTTTPLFLSLIISKLDPDNQYIYNIVSLGIYIMIILLVTLGLQVSKWLIFLSGTLKWATIIGGIILAIILASQKNDFVQNILKNDSVTPGLIVASCMSFIYSFGGFESLAGISSDVKSKSLKKNLMAVFIFILSFYFIVYLIFLFLDSATINGKDFGFETVFQLTLGSTGIILLTIGLFFNRFSATISNLLYFSKAIAALSQDGFLPKILQKKNKKGEFGNSLWFITIITIVSMILFYFIPQLFHIEQTFDLFLEALVISFFAQYSLTIWTVLYLDFVKKEYKIKIWEKIIYFLVLILITLIIIFFVSPPIFGEAFSSERLFSFFSYIFIMAFGYIVWLSTLFFNKYLAKYFVKKR